MRLDMLRLAVKGLSYVKVCDLEQSKDAYHYTFQTLLTLNRMYPEVQFYFIMGADSLFDFEDWREPGIISQECILLAAARDHCRLEEIQQQIRMLKEKYNADIRIPVSYTHLDVYKRQAYRNGRRYERDCMAG